MKKRTGKMISLSLAVAMAMTAAPVTALAVDETVLTTAQNAGETGTDTTTVDTKEEVGLTQLEPATVVATPVVDGAATAGDADGVTPLVEEVAEVNNVKYPSLQEAINAANPGDTVTLLKDVTVDSDADQYQGAGVEITKAITLDGDNHTITAGTFKNKNSLIGITGVDGHVVLKDLVLSGGTVSNNAVNAYKSTNVEINNVTVTDTKGYGLVVNSSDVTVKSMNILTAMAINVDQRASRNSNLVVEDGTFDGMVVIENTGSNNKNSDVTITGGTFNSFILGSSTDGDEISISGGTFEKGVKDEYLADGYELNENGEVIVDVTKYPVSIGDKNYASLDAALTAATSGQTIRLMTNIEVDHAITIPAGVTLDGGKNTTITLTAELANGAFITAGGDNVTIQNITIDTNENAKHGVQFYCVKGGEMDNVAVNGGYYTSVIVNGAEATIKNSTLNLDEGKGYANIEFAVGDGVTTVPKVTIENVTTTPDKPVVYMDNTTFTRIKGLEDMSEITREELNANNVTGAFLYYYDNTASDPDDTLPVITFDPTEGSIADSAKTQKINKSGHLASLPTASRSGYRLDGWYTKAEGGDKITTDTLFTENTTVYAQWSKKSSGGSSHSYDGYITIINPKNGEVSVSDDWAYEDDKITLTITPDDGYEVDKIEIVDDEGDKIDAKKVDDEDNKYTFRMANCDVTVTVTFKEEGKTTEDTDKEEDKDDEETTELNFTDVKESDWFYKGVAYVVDKGVMSGVSENQFDPSGKLTRAMMVQMLYNMEDRPACDAENAFIDVPVGQWYTDAVIWANDEKIVSGMGDGLFAPNMEITREQMVVMLYNYAKYKGYDVTASADLSKFADNASVSTWAQPAMQWAVAEGYISGMGDNQLAPQGTATRAEIASVIMRFMEATAESAETAE